MRLTFVSSILPFLLLAAPAICRAQASYTVCIGESVEPAGQCPFHADYHLDCAFAQAHAGDADQAAADLICKTYRGFKYGEMRRTRPTSFGNGCGYIFGAVTCEN